jgi:hypothetical protein
VSLESGTIATWTAIFGSTNADFFIFDEARAGQRQVATFQAKRFPGNSQKEGSLLEIPTRELEDAG